MKQSFKVRLRLLVSASCGFCIVVLSTACGPARLQTMKDQLERTGNSAADVRGDAPPEGVDSKTDPTGDGGGQGDLDPEAATPLFQAFQLAIDRNCVACHGGPGSPFGGIVSFAELKNPESWLKHPVGLVVPGEPLKSPIYNRTTHAAGKVPGTIRSNMPFVAGSFGSSDFPDEDGKAIFEYIQALGGQNPPNSKDDPSGLQNTDAEPPPASVLAKVKYISHGGAPTVEELRAVMGPDGKLRRDELRRLILSWLETGPGKQKLEDFFKITLDQHDFVYPTNDGTMLFGRFLGGGGARAAQRLTSNIQESFLRSAMDIVERKQPFSEIVTTRRFAVTSALLSAYRFADGAGRPNGFNERSEDFSRFLQTLTDQDFNDWRFVSLRTGSNTILYNNISGIRVIGEGASFNLRISRAGFFNTLAFQLKNETNVDNDFRVSASQALIVALHKTFEAGDSTAHGDLSALAATHAAPGTSCFSCHRLLDPMREAFRTTYTTNYLYDDGSRAKTPAFAFSGFSGPANSIPVLANTIANHPHFAAGWVSKMCAYANSEPCDEADESFLDVVARFKQSNHVFKDMVADLLSSSVVTRSGGGMPEIQGQALPASLRGLVSVSRKNHFCHALETRYRDLLTSKGLTYSFGQPLCSLNQNIVSAASTLPSDKTLRGSQIIVQASSPDALGMIGYRNICRELSSRFVNEQANSAFRCCSAADVTQAIADMTQSLMGLPSNHPRHEPAKAALSRFFMNARRNLSLTDLAALRETFVASCMAPDLLGVGL